MTNADAGVRAGAALGLGLAYAGTRREEVAELLVPLVIDTDTSMEARGAARLGAAAGVAVASAQLCAAVLV